MELRGKTKALCWLLSLALVLSLIPGMALTASAVDPVPYMAATVNESTHAVTFKDETCKDYTVVTTSNTDVKWGAGWYVVMSDTDVTIGSQITVTGDVHLILCDGAKLTVNGGINCSGYNLTIYAQSAGTGALVVANGSSNDGIFANNLAINGGKVTASSDSKSAICSNIDITINGGSVTANGTSNGLFAGNGSVTINGGAVTASGNDSGIHNGDKGAVTINGGEVTATGGQKALFGNVINAIAGTGWTNTEGTGNGETITISNDGRTLDTYKKVQFHTHDGITFQPWTSTTGLPTEAGNYYLTGNVTLTKTWTVPGTVKLCLNGYGIQMNEEKRVIFIGGNTLELYDCNSERVHYVTLEDWRGTAVSDNGTVSAVTNGYGIVKVNGGYITGGYAKEKDKKEGGAVYIGADGTFTMHGGTILGNKSDDGLGGGIWSGGTLNIGGTSRVNYNSGKEQNSGVYLAEKANAFNVSGTPNFTGNRGRDIVFNNNTYKAGTRINFTYFDPAVRLGRVYIQTNLTGVITSNAKFESVKQIEDVMQLLTEDSVIGIKNNQAVFVHVHGSFTYADGASEDTITATCGSKSDCDLPKRQATLTIAAPLHAVYGDGESAEAVITDPYTIQGDTGVIRYYAVSGGSKTGDPLSGAPTDAGEYWAEITLANVKTGYNETNNSDIIGDVTAHVVYTIAKATQTITASDVTATYGDTDKKVEATTDGNGAISYAVKEGSAYCVDVDTRTGALKIKEAGTATIVITAEETQNYAQATKEVTVTIGKNIAVPATVTANNRTYDGTEKPLVTVTGEAKGGTMQYYAYTIGADTKPALLVDWRETIPTATNAGTYKVYYKAVGDAYHIASDVACVEVTISEVPVYDYDEPVAYKVNLPASVPGGTVTVSRSSAASGSTVTVTPVADDGFRVGEVTVTDAAGKAVTVRDNGDGTWSFTMPASDVTVGVTFQENLKSGYSGCDHGAGCLLNGFTDLDPNAWYHDGVHFCLENGFMIGMGDGRFDPDGATTRAMIVTVLYRVEGKPAVTGGSPFGDVATGAWYTDAVIWAAANGIVNGYEDGTFHPDDAITREQLAAILYRYAQTKGQGFQGLWSFRLDFPDAGEVSEWADEAMHWMVMNGVVGGKDGRLLPRGNASRAETATMLQRFYELIAK